MAVHTGRPQVHKLPSPRIDLRRIRNIYPKLATAKSGANIRLRHRIHVRIDPHRKSRGNSEPARDRIDLRQLAFRFTVEITNPAAQRELDRSEEHTSEL